MASSNVKTDLTVVPVELRKLILKRNSASRSMDVIKKYVTKFNLESQSLTQLEVRLEKLKDHMQLFEEYQLEIELFENASAEMINERSIVEDEFYNIKAMIVDIINKNKQSSHNRHSTQSNSQTIVRDTMKLPAISAPSFDGNLQNWVSFLDTFNAMFHNNSSLAEVQRLHYLKSCLTGSAAEVIRTIPTTEENYQMAYNTLIERYENKSLIIQSHIRSLFSTAQVSQPSATELRKLHHHVISQVRTLKALKQPVEHWDAWLITLVCSKLDAITVGEWQLRQATKELPKFTEIEQFLASRVSAYEVGEVDKPMKDSVPLSISNMPKININIKSSTCQYKQYKSKLCRQVPSLFWSTQAFPL